MAVHLPSFRVKRSHHKSRLGCTTCKRRRVKVRRVIGSSKRERHIDSVLSVMKAAPSVVPAIGEGSNVRMRSKVFKLQLRRTSQAATPFCRLQIRALARDLKNLPLSAARVRLCLRIWELRKPIYSSTTFSTHRRHSGRSAFVASRSGKL